MEEYSRAIARCAAGQIADAMGFEAVQESAIDMLSELMLRYISEVGTASHTYAQLAGRTDMNAGDVGKRTRPHIAATLTGINLTLKGRLLSPVAGDQNHGQKSWSPVYGTAELAFSLDINADNAVSLRIASCKKKTSEVLKLYPRDIRQIPSAC
eukprot:scaffold397605_cov25-Prasinocladus_malaysianus.AAC.1